MTGDIALQEWQRSERMVRIQIPSSMEMFLAIIQMFEIWHIFCSSLEGIKWGPWETGRKNLKRESVLGSVMYFVLICITTLRRTGPFINYPYSQGFCNLLGKKSDFCSRG